MQSNLQERDFAYRLRASEAMTYLVMRYLVKIGHFRSFEKATYEDDKEGGIDYWVDCNNAEVEPIQFKMRIKKGNSDFPVVRYQPFWGVDSAESVVGRDYRGLMEGKTLFYYVSTRNADGSFEIYRASKKRLVAVLKEMEEAWSAHDISRPWYLCKSRCTGQKNSFLLRSRVNEQGKGKEMIFIPNESGSVNWEIWWQKNPNERFPKINFYLPSSLKENSWTIPAATYNSMLRAADAFAKLPTVCEKHVSKECEHVDCGIDQV